MNHRLLQTLNITILLLSFTLLQSVANAQTDSQTTEVTSINSKDKASKNKKKSSQSIDQKLSKKEREQLSFEYLQRATYYANSNRALAKEYCEKAIELSPDDSKFPYLCRQILSRLEYHERALELSERVLELDPSLKTNCEYLDEHVTLLLNLGKYEEALATYQNCEVNSTEFIADMLARIAEIEMALGNPEKAIARYNQSLEIEPNNEFAIFGKVIAQIRAGEAQNAKETFLSGVQIDPELTFLDSSIFFPDAEVQFQKAVLFLFSHRPKEALYYLNKYISQEQRTKYRELAEALKEDINNGVYGQGPVKSWPVILSNVNVVAIRGNIIAFSDQGTDSLWFLNTETGKTAKKLEDVEVKAIAFDQGTGFLRVVTPSARYAIDPDKPGFYIYQNEGSEIKWFGLTQNGQTLLGSNDNNELVVAPFMAPNQTATITQLPQDFDIVLYNKDKLIISTSFANATSGPIIKAISANEENEVFSSNIMQSSGTTCNSGFALGLLHGAILLNKSGKVTARYSSPDQKVHAIAYDSQRNRLVTVSGLTAEVWDLPQAETLN